MADGWRDQLDNLIDVQAGDPNFYWEGQAPRKNRGQGNIETNIPPMSRAPTGPGPQSGHEDPDLQDQIFGYQRPEDDPADLRDPRDIGAVGAGRYRVGRPEQRQFPFPGEQPDVRLPPARQPEDDVRQYGGPRPMWAPPDAPATKASDKPRQPGWEGMLDDMLGGQGANHVPQSQWRTMLDNLGGFIGTAEARGARPRPPTQAPTPAPGETPPADNRIGTTREDGAMWDGSRWVTSDQQQAQQARETAAQRTARGQRSPARAQPPAAPGGEPDRGWASNAIATGDRWINEAKAGFGRRIEQAEAEGTGKSLRERAQAYNRAFDPGLEAGIASGPQVGIGEGIKQTFSENYDKMTRHYQALLDNFSGQNQGDTGYGRRALGALGNAAMVGLGPIGMGLSPLQGTYRSIVAQPAENALGLPKWVTEGALMLGTPGIGIPRLGGSVGSAVGWTTRQAANVLQEAPGIKQGAHLIQSEFFPQMQEGGEAFRDAWQAFHGQAAQMTEKDFDAARKYYPALINAPRDFGPNGVPTLKDPQVNFMNYLDGGPSATRPEGDLGKLADILRPAFEQVKKDAKSTDRWAEQQWRDQFFPHYWEDPNAASGVASSFTGGGGGGGHLKERVYNYVEDGIKAGLMPKYEPMEMAMRYLTDMRRMIAQEKVFAGARDAGIVSDVPKPGMIRLNNLGPGRDSKYYAPEGWAHSWNNITSRGFAAMGEGAGNFADYMRRYTNFSTQMMMGFINNFHALTIGESGWAMEASRALNQIWSDRGAVDNLKGVTRLLASPTAGLQYAVRGKMFKDAYLAKDTFWSRFLTPDQVQMIHDLGPQAGMRFAGTRHTTDWSSSAMGDIYTRFKRAAESYNPASEGFGKGLDYAMPFVGRASRERFRGLTAGQYPGMAAKVVASDIAASMQATQYWLMEKGVPLMKSGAMGEHMQDFLRLHPNATAEQTREAFRSISDYVDHRMGEAVQDHIYWDKWIKQLAQMAMVSYSWNRGAVNVIGGGISDQVNRQMGKGGSAPWTPKDHYLLMTIMNSSIMNSIYQKIKTGEWPSDIRDLLGGRTGGTIYQQRMDQSQSGNDKLGPWTAMPERIQMPGLFPKEFAGVAEHGLGELGYKLNPGAGLATDLWDIAKKPGGDFLGNVWNAIVNRMTPISMQQRWGPASGTGMFERAISASPAKPIITNPDYKRRAEWMEQHMPPLSASRIPGIKASQRERDEFIKAHPGIQEFTTKDVKKWKAEQNKYGGPQ